MTDKQKRSGTFTANIAILQDDDLTASEKLVYLVIASHAYAWSETVFPSINTIATLSSLSPQGTRNAINQLVARGWLLKEERKKVSKSGKVSNTSNMYTIVQNIGDPLHSVDHPPSTECSTPPTQGVVPPLHTVYPNLSTYSFNLKKDSKDLTMAMATPFDRFWDMYPKKERKSRALAKYKNFTSNGKADPEQIIAALANYIRVIEIKGREREYILNAANFLEEWADYLEVNFDELQAEQAARVGKHRGRNERHSTPGGAAQRAVDYEDFPEYDDSEFGTGGGR